MCKCRREIETHTANNAALLADRDHWRKLEIDASANLCEAKAEIERLKHELETKGEMFLTGQIAKLRKELETKPASYPGQVTKLINEHERIKAELVEAIREVEHWRSARRDDLAGFDIALEREKRRTAVYWQMLYERKLISLAAYPTSDEWKKKTATDELNAEAQKLLADSGGEKDFKSQQKGDSKDGNAS